MNLKNRVNGIKGDEKEVEKMCKAIEDYAEKRIRESDAKRIKNLATNGASIDLILASFPDVPRDDIQAIFDNILKKE